jgi:hypothetical protein
MQQIKLRFHFTVIMREILGVGAEEITKLRHSKHDYAQQNE